MLKSHFATAVLLTAALLASVLLLIEAGLHALLGNYGISKLWEHNPGDGRCIGLKPGAETDYTGWLFRIPPVHLAVNADGYRGPRRPKAKADDTYRILLIGDSFAFGQAVTEPETISAQLEKTLGDCGGRRVEVLNFGVPGLNMEEVLDQYRRFARQWQHDLVLYLAFKNDLEGPLCRAHRTFSIMDSATFQRLNRNVYTIRLLYVVFMMGATATDASDPSMLERLRRTEDGLVGQARLCGAKLGVIMLGDPLLKQFPEGKPWVPPVPMLDVSDLLDSPHIVRREGHLDGAGDRILAIEAAAWIQANFCEQVIAGLEAAEKPITD